VSNVKPLEGLEVCPLCKLVGYVEVEDIMAVCPRCFGEGLVAKRQASPAAGGDPVGFLTRLIDEYDRLTGRTEHHQVTPVEAQMLTGAVLA